VPLWNLEGLHIVEGNSRLDIQDISMPTSNPSWLGSRSLYIRSVLDLETSEVPEELEMNSPA
jgi:hypothetical protein